MRPTLFLLAFAVTATATAEEHRYLKAFPAAEDTMQRYVILLPEKTREEESAYRVEIVVGKEIDTDGVNQYRLGGTLTAKPLQGWGFTYYELKKFGPTISTQMAPPPGAPRVRKFVAASSLLIDYNSRVPLVVYVPEDGEVRYRIWKAPDSFEKASKG